MQELQIGTYADQLHELQQNYKFLLNYYVNGVEDPDRKTVYNKLISRVFNLASALREELLMRSSSAFEYTQQRYFPHTRYYISVKELFISLNYYHSQTALIEHLESTHEVELSRLSAYTY